MHTRLNPFRVFFRKRASEFPERIVLRTRDHRLRRTLRRVVGQKIVVLLGEAERRNCQTLEFASLRLASTAGRVDCFDVVSFEF